MGGATPSKSSSIVGVVGAVVGGAGAGAGGEGMEGQAAVSRGVLSLFAQSAKGKDRKTGMFLHIFLKHVILKMMFEVICFLKSVANKKYCFPGKDRKTGIFSYTRARAHTHTHTGTRFLVFSF